MIPSPITPTVFLVFAAPIAFHPLFCCPQICSATLPVVRVDTMTARQARQVTKIGYHMRVIARGIAQDAL
jgi:hypothetical protein